MLFRSSYALGKTAKEIEAEIHTKLEPPGATPKVKHIIAAEEDEDDDLMDDLNDKSDSDDEDSDNSADNSSDDMDADEDFDDEEF